MKTLKEKIEVMQAALDGKEVEYDHGNGFWESCSPTWDWASWDYRIKPEPMECWVNVYPEGCTYIHDSKEAAENRKETGVEMKTIKVREVIE